ncbi:MAG TPA: hypothetical protein VMK12_13045 [Anaeromyxobacteraceae bacterium]|nr:hypothetical protein [Anaeromyxobacteraceae bacterium]
MSVIAGLVIETLEGAAPRVAARLLHLADLEIQGGDGDHRLAAVWTAPDSRSLAETVQRLIAADPEVLGIFPTFVADDSEERGD